jgi:PKD repeat protein
MLITILASGINSCKKDKSAPLLVKARFSAVNDAINGFKANIVNTSENAKEYIWDFGDGQTGTQTDSAFSITYKKASTYTIKLVAKNASKADSIEKDILIVGLTFKQLLSGTDAAGKVWRLAFTGGVNMFNPVNLSEWWYGWDQLSTDSRNTVRHHEYVFKPDGSFEFKTNGWTIRPGAAITGTSHTILFASGFPDSRGFPDSASWIVGGKNCSTWGNNSNLSFTINKDNKYPVCTKGRILISGKGGHIGPMDTGTELVVDEPAYETFYDVYSYGDGGEDPDTLVLYTPWGSNELGVGATRVPVGVITLLAYKNNGQIPADEKK